ncbi:MULTISPECIES: helix-turn-helix domain-containing protein [unclassified Polynucleobacter]|uniref:helix-turn-helix domain-containing protein n=1 Tax=unclassified Polynucleobacter TaxID=2640945 RepID=UPI0008AC1B89|nr:MULTISPECIES: helix-turn-helix domain-containing protein [unclassified Polynucleobacter]OHC10322.1 MAG: hypothetical protein A2X74_00290 [Polynucleobacter sp. GWA2_45_21]HBK44150.1 MerR family transcriptional regulator [Polynucleobacter sp.]
METQKLTFDELCALSGLSSRTLRYYTQIGLIDKPIGQTRAAHYTSLHLEKALRIKQLTESGISLERIREVLSGETLPLPVRTKKPGQIEVKTHLWIADGVELQVSPESANLSPEALREFLQSVMHSYEQITKDKK